MSSGESDGRTRLQAAALARLGPAEALAQVIAEIDRLVVYAGQKSPNEAHHGVPAPHKPLLLLLAVRRSHVLGLPRMMTFAEVEAPLRELLVKYGTGQTQHPEYPFVRLRTAPVLWDTTLTEDDVIEAGDASAAYLREHGVRAGLSAAAHAVVQDSEAAAAVARYVLRRWFNDRGPRERFEIAMDTGVGELVLS